MTKPFDLVEALSETRIPWARIVAEGHDLRQIEIRAGEAGDFELVRRVRRAIARRG